MKFVLLMSFTLALLYSLTLTRQVVEGVFGIVHEYVPSFSVTLAINVHEVPLSAEYSIVTKLDVRYALVHVIFDEFPMYKVCAEFGAVTVITGVGGEIVNTASFIS